jgi:RIO-like serine/threonine protein kinase
MKKERLDNKLDKISEREVFLKPESGLETELFVFSCIGLPEDAKRQIMHSYSPKERVKLMRDMYKISPETIAKPLGLIKRDKIYAFEYINGENITTQAYKLRNDKPLMYSVIGQLRETIKKLHDNGYVHGDLVGGNNIMLTYDNKIKLIDPLYIPKEFNYKQAFIELDNEAVEKLSNYLLGEDVKTNEYE